MEQIEVLGDPRSPDELIAPRYPIHDRDHAFDHLAVGGERYGMMVSDPEMPWSVAVMVTDTAETPVTTPDDDTVAAAPLEVDHVAELVTSCVVPSDIAAVAVNCEVEPTAGADPVTAIAVTVADAEVIELHPSANTNSPSPTANDPNR